MSRSDRSSGAPPQQGTIDDVRRFIREGHTISAIKLYRQIHKVGLKEAKEAVEAEDY